MIYQSGWNDSEKTHTSHGDHFETRSPPLEEKFYQGNPDERLDPQVIEQ